MKYKIAILNGDGVGPEVMKSAIKVLDTISEISDFKFEYVNGLIGGEAYEKYKNPFPIETKKIIDLSDAVLLGAVGGPKWDNIKSELRPEKGLLELRKYMEVYANIRPVKLIKGLEEASPLKNHIIKGGVDLCFVRELTGGIYFGERKTGIENNIRYAYDKEYYNEEEIKRISIVAFETAKKRNKKLTSVDKMNVLDSSKLWRTVVEEVSESYPDIELNHMYVDNAAMQLIKDPKQFDVILTNNIFGDILSDEASMITGSIGLLSSASLGSNKGLYEPIHGSAPDIAGLDIVNPIGMIFSVVLMLRHSFQMEKEASLIEKSVAKVLEMGYGTNDIYGINKKVSTIEWTEHLINVMKN